MKMTTKTIASLMVITAISAAIPGASQLAHIGRKRQESQFDRLLQRHDRKGELRAEVLGIAPLEFKHMQKRMTFRQITNKCGFSSQRAFRLALLGRLRTELRQRGWTTKEMDEHVHIRLCRMA